jgi:hypothetical protein
MTTQRWVLFVGMAVGFAAVPAVALADAGLPMLAFMWPGMGYALIPVIVIETIVMMRMLKTALGRTAVVVTVANLVTTVAGVPLTWALAFGVQLLMGGGGVGPSVDTIAGKLFAVTVQAPWLLPYVDQSPWMIPAAALFLLVPFFFASWLIEYWVARWTMRDIDHGDLRRAVMWANLASYALLALVTLGFLIAALV